MKTLVLFASLLILTHSAFASYEIQAELELPKSKPFIEKVIVEENKSTTLSFERALVEIEPVAQSNNTVQLNLTVSEKQNKALKPLATPKLIVVLGRSTEISSRSKTGELEYRLKLTLQKSKSK